MRIRSITNSYLRPAVLSLGTASLGADIDRATSFKILDAYLAKGGNFIDTANVYSDWIPGEKSRSEKLIGAWMKERKNRDQVILATKGGHPNPPTFQIPRLTAQEISADLDTSLSHLQVDCVDLYWLHRDDPKQPVADLMETLAGYVRAGKIRYYGCSNWRVDRIQAAQTYAAANGLPGFVGVQNLWNLAKIDPENLQDPTHAGMDEALWQYHRTTQLAAMPFTSQANGLFQKLETGQVERLSPGMRKMVLNPETQARFERLLTLKAETGLTATQVVLAYLTSQPFPTFPVIGPQNTAQLEDCLSAADVMLSPDQIRFLLRPNANV
jgi:aryl-alcohol dehydrogenase-like predicted oxidoreductase